jgi:hypothetical protein
MHCIEVFPFGHLLAPPPGPSLSLLSLPGGFGKKKNIAIYLKKFNV